MSTSLAFPVFGSAAGSSLSRLRELVRVAPTLNGAKTTTTTTKKASSMFTRHTAFLRVQLFCKEKRFIERCHLLIYLFAEIINDAGNLKEAFGEVSYHCETVVLDYCRNFSLFR